MFFKSKNKIQKRTLENEVPQKKRNRFSRWLFYFLGIIFLGVSTYVFFFSPFLQIKKIYLQGLEELEYEKVMADVKLVTEGKYGNLVSKNNILLVRSQELEGRLREKYKKIRSVETRIIFPETLIVSISERQALLVWCSRDECSLVDEKGFAYASADFNSEEVAENNLIIIRDQSQSPVLDNQAVISVEVIDFLIALRREMKERLDIELAREFETPKSISGDILATTHEGWKLKLNKDLGVEKEIAMLQIVLSQNISQDKRAELEYVDLRMEDKVYYKFKSAEPQESANEKK